MTVVYVNDTTKPQAVCVGNLNNFVTTLEPGASERFFVHCADDQGIFVKVWDWRVLISRTDLEQGLGRAGPDKPDRSGAAQCR